MSNRRYEFLKELLKYVEAYENDKGISTDWDIKEFTQWLSVQALPTEIINDTAQKEESLGELVTSIYRYAKLYSKKAMEDTPLSSIDDFGYLINLFVFGTMTKTDVIARNIHEKTTGMEIIKRLVKQGFLSQTNDPNDGRSQLVSITDAGRQVLFPLLNKMRQVETIAQGQLSPNEQQMLLYLLKKLHVFHNNIFKNERNIDLDVIQSKYFQ